MHYVLQSANFFFVCIYCLHTQCKKVDESCFTVLFLQKFKADFKDWNQLEEIFSQIPSYISTFAPTTVGSKFCVYGQLSQVWFFTV